MLLLLAFVTLFGNTAEASRLEDYAHGGLAFLREQQSGGRDGYDPGQWRAEVTTTLPDALGIGKFGHAYEEPTVFVASSVANALAETHFLDPALDEIPPLVAKTVAGFAPYRWGPVFHFYPPSVYRGVPVRAPRYLFLEPQWQGFTNTPPDADSTSVSYLAMAYDRAIREQRSPRDSGFPLPSGAERAFATYRDVGRDPHVYNGIHGDLGTGAFLTWLWDERDPRMPRDWFAPPDAGTRIPFGKNDVDCVVNANVLKALTATRREATPGYAEACAYLNGVAAREELYTCGMYYPSEYMLPYAMASAMQLGARCLEPSRERLLDAVLSRQLPDGSWRNDWKSPTPDYVQSTSWALNTLLLLGNPRDRAERAAARRALAFLLSRARRDRHGHVYWDGEIFYAATFLARRTIVWRSAAYTTATAIRALVAAERLWNLSD